MDIKKIQISLLAAGFSPGPIDGIWGRRGIAALQSYQRARGDVATGVLTPQIAGALRASESGGNSDPIWLAEARRRLGLCEVTHKKTLMDFLRSDKRTLGDPAKLPWCGDFIDTCIARTLPGEPMLANPYWARNWAAFGEHLDSPALGAILVFSRPGGGGHVGFCVGEDARNYGVLGGNQTNAVTIAQIAKSRCIAIRWPTTGGDVVMARLARAIGAVSTNEA